MSSCELMTYPYDNVPACRNPSGPGGAAWPGGPLDRVVIAKGAGGARLQELLALCRERGIPVRVEPRERLDRAANGANHQGVIGVRRRGEVFVDR